MATTWTPLKRRCAPLGKESYDGRNIRFGVREHAMGAVMSGMFLHGGIHPYGRTFLVFADYVRPAILLIGTGAEVHLALKAQELLAEKGAAARVINMPSWELFEQASETYRREVLPPQVKARLAVEAGIPMGWERYVGDGGHMIGISGFGASAPGGTVLEKFGFMANNVAARALALLGKS